uniref:BHLH domain-containing protein n=1 Tax=Falco tinnunculus TaxID=100819 RepID=A0A8C4TTW8_FALTI
MPLRFTEPVGGTPSPLPPCQHRGGGGDCPLWPQEAWPEWGLSLVKSNKSPKWEAAAKGNNRQLCPQVPHLQFQWTKKAPDQDELWSSAAPGPHHPAPPVPPEGEEIDVVTVEKRQSLSLRKPVTITLRADPLDPCMKRFHISVHQQQHNYAARSPPDACPPPEPPQQDKDEPLSTVEPTPAITLPEPSLPKAGNSPGSDSEDVAKRKNHNYLERKRRNDLRSRFLALRDQVPGLASCPKTPKVVILSKSSEYLQSLISTERRMAAEKRQLRLRQTQLLKRIAHLKGH